VSVHSTRAARALAHLAELDPALGVLALWCQHRDGTETRTDGDVITYGAGFDTLGLPEQVGTVAHHVLHVALRHSQRQATLCERLGAGFDPALYALASDAIVNQTLILAGHPIPRPGVTLREVLAEAGLPARSEIDALAEWDADRLAMALARDGARGRKVSDWARARGFAPDLGPSKQGGTQGDGEWRNHMLRAMEAGRKAGSGIGRLGLLLADMEPDRMPWEVILRRALALALVERPRPNWRRPAGRWIARASAAEGPDTPAFEPGRQRMDQRARIVIGVDTSSSIEAEDFRLFAAEAQGIAKRSGAELHLLAFDEAVFDHQTLSAEGWARLDPSTWRRGGGTDYVDLFAKAARLTPSVAVILTDLDAPLPPRPAFPVIWAVPGPVEAPPYGRVIRMDDA